MQGPLEKLHTTLNTPIEYTLALGDKRIALNALLGRPITLTHTGNIFCTYCQTLTKKSFNQGYCYRCFIRLAQCDMCILKPETCHFAHGTCREPEWAGQFCFQPHIVYLANSSGIKVGITRHNQVPTRWIDQGAIQALPIFKTASRHISGLIEVVLAQHIPDKTSWQKMLKHQIDSLDLRQQRDELLEVCAAGLADIKNRYGQDTFELLPDEMAIELDYPVMEYPIKIKSFNFDNDTKLQGVLQGIKGQYLLLDTGVINIRKFTGYEVVFSA